MNRGRDELLRQEQSADAMGACFSVILYGRDAGEMDEAIGAAFAEVWRLDEMLSIYRSTSEWSRINREAAREAVQVSSESFHLLTRCREYTLMSDGAFDIGIGSLLKTWGFHRGRGRMPGAVEIALSLGLAGFRHIDLDADRKTARFDRPGVCIDPGGIGKGYAIDRMADLLRRRGFEHALLTASGSSIFGMGAPPGRPGGWPVHIRDPENPGKSTAQIDLKDESLSTSGRYEKMFLSDGGIYSHILDPRTGYPGQGVRQVSVITPCATDGEAWAKAYFLNGAPWAKNHRPKEQRILLLEENGPATGTWLE